MLYFKLILWGMIRTDDYLDVDYFFAVRTDSDVEDEVVVFANVNNRGIELNLDNINILNEEGMGVVRYSEDKDINKDVELEFLQAIDNKLKTDYVIMSEIAREKIQEKIKVNLKKHKQL